MSITTEQDNEQAATPTSVSNEALRKENGKHDIAITRERNTNPSLALWREQLARPSADPNGARRVPFTERTAGQQGRESTVHFRQLLRARRASALSEECAPHLVNNAAQRQA